MSGNCIGKDVLKHGSSLQELYTWGNYMMIWELSNSLKWHETEESEI